MDPLASRVLRAGGELQGRRVHPATASIVTLHSPTSLLSPLRATSRVRKPPEASMTRRTLADGGPAADALLLFTKRMKSSSASPSVLRAARCCIKPTEITSLCLDVLPLPSVRLPSPSLVYTGPLVESLPSALSRGALLISCSAASRRRRHLTFLSQENISQVSWRRPSWGLVLSAFTATRVVFWSLCPSVASKFTFEDWKAAENNDGQTQCLEISLLCLLLSQHYTLTIYLATQLGSVFPSLSRRTVPQLNFPLSFGLQSLTRELFFF